MHLTLFIKLLIAFLCGVGGAFLINYLMRWWMIERHRETPDIPCPPPPPPRKELPPLPPFGNDPECPKCGNWHDHKADLTVEMRYCPGWFPGRFGVVNCRDESESLGEEHFHLTCRRCGYTWKEAISPKVEDKCSPS